MTAQLLTLDEALSLVDISHGELIDAITRRRLRAVTIPWQAGRNGSRLRLRTEDLQRFAGGRWHNYGEGAAREAVDWRTFLEIDSTCDRCGRYATGEHCALHATRLEKPSPLPRELTDSERAAFHEAGHACLARELGWPVRSVTIEPFAEARRRYGGECVIDPPACDTRAGVRDYLSFSLAGPVAVAMAKRDDWRAFNLDDVRDQEGGQRFWTGLVRDVLGDEAGTRWPRWLEAATQLAATRANSVLERRWANVTVLAMRLVDCRTVRYPA